MTAITPAPLISLHLQFKREITPCSHTVMSTKLKALSKKRTAEDDNDSNAPQAKKVQNKQRVLVLSSRGVTERYRHLMNDLQALLPHTKKGNNVVCL